MLCNSMLDLLFLFFFFVQDERSNANRNQGKIEMHIHTNGEKIVSDESNDLISVCLV